ncbi:hypothetical protein [uncultured Rubinisphaera sp.]|uniref:hypothetical protein n=1 Tax=uncultured Rubinisphaera sp. TaxID=1678686 RepID=UPI0030DC3399|tara:strand:+ start:2130 stop:2432 length:303 start_codon:yes stop_codon:yes gene_type:complete
MSQVIARLLLIPGVLILSVSIYVLSFAPFLKVVSLYEDGFQNPWVAYQPVLWCIWKTPLQKPLLNWANLFGVQSETEMQAWLFVQDVRLEDMHFNYNFEK